MADQWTCERCGGELAEGFIPDYLEDDAALGPLEWVEGAPKTSFWSGLKTGAGESSGSALSAAAIADALSCSRGCP